MNSSGIKRGLAATAITALAVTGVPFLATSAHAIPIVEQYGATDVDLVTPDTVASFKADGVNSTVHLVAAGGSSVTQVQFQYSTGGAYINIGGPVSRSNGTFSTEWAPPPAIFNTSVDVRAEALSNVGTPINTDTNNVLVTANAESVDIATAPGSAKGYFLQPYAGEGATAPLSSVNGTTSDLAAGSVDVFDWFSGNTTTEDVSGPVAAGDTTRTWSAPVDLTGYSFDTVDPKVDEALFYAVADGDDAEPVVLRKQTITTVTVTSEPATVQSGGEADITVTVLDQLGQPVVGAQVVAEDVDPDFAGGGTIYTNSQGQAVFEGADSAGAPGATYDFYVNTTDTNGFQPATDFRRSATVTSYAPTATTITSSSKDGAAFDEDEYAAGDLTAVVKDQNGAPLANQTVSYTLSLAPFPTTPVTPTPPPVTGSTVTDAQGVATIPWTDLGDGTYTLKTFVERDGTPGQSAGDLAAADLVFKAGDSTLAFTEAPSATSAAGTTDTYEATLKLADGTPLPGRPVSFNYTATGNVVVAAQANQPAGTTRVSDTTATDVTDATGAVSVALSDPATPDQAELNGSLDAVTTAPTSTGPDEADEDAVNLDVDFVDATPPALTTVTITPEGATHKPGVTTGGTVTVVADTDGDPATPGTTPVVGLAVTLTVDKGFFTDGTPDPAPAVGADQGEFKSLGQTITVVTGAGGVANFQTAIERDAGFDDDGLVKATVTATAGAFNDTEDYDYSSAAPLNGGTVELVESPASEQDGDTDPARTGQQVAFDVFTTDQFGNLVGSAPITITTDSSDATVTGAPVTSDFDDDGDFTVTSSEEEDVVVTGTWNAPVNEYIADGIDAGTVPDSGPATTRNITDNDTASFYEVDFAASDITITSSPEGTVPVGTAVTETVTVVDQEGNPVANLDVEFFRTGPDAGGGDANVQRTTNSNGQAFYTFIGSQEGTAQITATITDGNALRTVTDTVVFGTTPNPDNDPKPIKAFLSGKDNGPAKDKLTVKAPAMAAGAEVRLFKVIKGKRIQVGNTKGLNAAGDATFIVKDTNGGQITKYVAVVVKTDKTLSDTTNPKRVR
jgi:hypothetical protein